MMKKNQILFTLFLSAACCFSGCRNAEAAPPAVIERQEESELPADAEKELPAETGTETDAATLSGAESETISGTIETIGETSFTVSLIETDSGAAVAPAPGYEDANERKEIHFTSETEFILRSVQGGGDSYTDATVSALALSEGCIIEAAGSGPGDVFTAETVLLYSFE